MLLPTSLSEQQDDDKTFVISKVPRAEEQQQVWAYRPFILSPCFVSYTRKRKKGILLTHGPVLKKLINFKISAMNSQIPFTPS